MGTEVHEADRAISSSEQLWHQRYGHLNRYSLRILRTKKLANGITFHHNDNESKEACDGCMKGKQTRISFPKESTKRENEILELIHTDVCGPMETRSLGGSRYFVTFINDKSRYTAIYFMKEKNEVSEIYKEYEAMVENVTGMKIKAIRLDNGGEYI